MVNPSKSKALHRVILSLGSKRPRALAACQTLYPWLQQRLEQVSLSPSAALALGASPTPPIQETLQQADALLVIGGDGSILSHAAWAMMAKKPLLGIHCGQLGFLADVLPHDTATLAAILQGEYHIEARQILAVEHWTSDTLQSSTWAVNEATFTHHLPSQLLTFQLTVNGQRILQQRADGMIIATPTGSTAYALSAGGPICHPSVPAILAVPICPHTLTSRPVVLPANSHCALSLHPSDTQGARVCLDGQEWRTISPGEHIALRSAPTPLQLMHPFGYDYFTRLSNKLHWERPAHVETTQPEEFSSYS